MQQKGSTGDTLMPMAPDRSVSIAASAASTASSVSQSWNHQNRRLRTEDTDPAKAIEAHSQRKGLATKTNPEMVLQPVATRCNPLQPVAIAAFSHNHHHDLIQWCSPVPVSSGLHAQVLHGCPQPQRKHPQQRTEGKLSTGNSSGFFHAK